MFPVSFKCFLIGLADICLWALWMTFNFLLNYIFTRFQKPSRIKELERLTPYYRHIFYCINSYILVERVKCTCYFNSGDIFWICYKWCSLGMQYKRKNILHKWVIKLTHEQFMVMLVCHNKDNIMSVYVCMCALYLAKIPRKGCTLS